MFPFFIFKNTLYKNTKVTTYTIQRECVGRDVALKTEDFILLVSPGEFSSESEFTKLRTPGTNSFLESVEINAVPQNPITLAT